MKQQYARLVTMAAWTATTVATLLLLVKIAAWWVTGSVSLLASLIDSMLDIAASVVNLLVVRYALQPADEEHTFGHGKAESLAALAQAMFISGSAVFLILNGVDRFFRPHLLNSPEYGVYVSLFAMVVTLGLVTFQKHVVKATGSQAIAADSLHYQSDLFMNAAIMLALGLSYFGVGQADAVFAVGIGLFILYSAFKMVSEAVQTLLDRKLPDEELEQINCACLTVEHVLGVHQLRTRMSGPTRFIQLHLELDDHLPLIKAHQIADEVEAKLLELFPASDVLIHQDPYSVVVSSEKEHIEQQWS
ncbi:divalent metal cation transporter FieF [Vibrio navarrensis]|uniref:Cation-efflux pump FieF n=1 Tax=Vibrio navarrensis TaxID=29495 RepID=A0AAJ4LU40_9VIBR|nr:MULTISPECIES: CDF family cation-efflux transporter FieF [Vibrio]KJR36913.1 ferrous iron transporter [Vibrio sp. S234-5]MBE3652651.1 divalent metal cation transporter FieF [Vibrio navarrensis]MBE3660849.1 divalent metal cation transporter FieF [Vibrio navarrensis]QPL53425.1 CDF family cation-efflux transporter FieF [Vibrio navarrensis]